MLESYKEAGVRGARKIPPLKVPRTTRIDREGPRTISPSEIWARHQYEVPNLALARTQLKEREREIRRGELGYQLRLFVMVGVGSQIRRLIAEVSSELAAIELGTSIPKVNFVDRSDANEHKWRGWYFDGESEIFVVDGVCFCQTARTSAHEVKHMAQYTNCDHARFSQEQNENCASYYGLSFQRKHAPTCAGCQ